MANEITQADRDLEKAIAAELVQMAFVPGARASAHRIAHETPLLAQIAELKAGLRKIENHCNVRGINDVRGLARAALATKDTPERLANRMGLTFEDTSHDPT